MRRNSALNIFLAVAALAFTSESFVSTCRADALSSVIEDGVRAYQQQDYIQAAASFETAVRNGLGNGHVWYNLGNSYYRLGKYGKAIASYRRAARDLPSDPDVTANLALAREKATDKVDPQPSLVESLLQLLPPVTTETYKRIFVGCYLLGWAGIAAGIAFRSRSAWTSGGTMLALALLTALPAFAVQPGYSGIPRLAFTPEARARQACVVTASEAKIYSGDGESYQVVFLLHDGAEILCGEQRGSWQEILLPDGRKGWLPASEIDTL